MGSVAAPPRRRVMNRGCRNLHFHDPTPATPPRTGCYPRAGCHKAWRCWVGGPIFGTIWVYSDLPGPILVARVGADTIGSVSAGDSASIGLDADLMLHMDDFGEALRNIQDILQKTLKTEPSAENRRRATEMLRASPGVMALIRAGGYKFENFLTDGAVDMAKLAATKFIILMPSDRAQRNISDIPHLGLGATARPPFPRRAHHDERASSTIGAAIVLAAIAGPTVYCVPLSSSTRRAGTDLGGP